MEMKSKDLLKLKCNHLIEQMRIRLVKMLYSDLRQTRRAYKKVFGRDIDLENPKTLNEKMQWLKLYDRKDYHTMLADKYAARDYIAKEFGNEYLVPLLFTTKDYHDIVPENIPDCHCIIKTTHGFGNHVIIRDNKDQLDFSAIRENLRFQMHSNYYDYTREWQYKNMKPRIIIEKLLETKEGKIPNDYKLHFINGDFQFIYVSYDREGVNDRCIFDKNWNRLPFMWIGTNSYKPTLNRSEVKKPETFDKMIEFGSKVAQLFKLVRVDFYDVDGKLYFGEITLHHGAGFDRFFPDEYDYIYGEKLVLK